MRPCEAPCEPPCVRPVVANVEWRGHLIGLCHSHSRRAKQGKPIDEPLGQQRVKASANERLVVLGTRVPQKLKAEVEEEARRRGFRGASEAAHEALVYWLASSPDEVQAKVGDEPLRPARPAVEA